MLREKLLPNGFGGVTGNHLPDDFEFVQNRFRSEDLETEERALVSLCYQEYDHLRMLSKLGVNSELYRYKMDQYKELSTMRAEIEKVLQEQRLEKIRRDFEKSKYEDERRYNHEKWLEDQKREILAAKLRNQATNGGSRRMNRANSQPDIHSARVDPKSALPITAYPQPQTSRYENPGTRNTEIPSFMNANIATQNFNHRNQYPVPQSARRRSDFVDLQPPTTGYSDRIPDTVVRDTTGAYTEETYNPKKGFGIHFDFLTNLQRNHRDVRLVYGVFNYKKVVVANREVGVMQSMPDPSNMSKNRVFFDKKHILKNVKPHAGNTLIMEFQVRRTDTEPGDIRYASIGWTLLNLFDTNYELNAGQFKLPIYDTPTQPDLDIRDIPKLSKQDKVLFCLRIAVPKDPIAKLKILPDTHADNYVMPRIHSEVLDKEAMLANENENKMLKNHDAVTIQKQIEEEKLQEEAYE
jgi:hypothetical protein